MDVSIYCLCDPVSKEIRYVGKAIDAHYRFRKHLTRKENNYKAFWIQSLKDRGLKPELEILEVIPNSNDKDWQTSEQFWISYLRSLGCRLTNLNGGGLGGHRPCEETRKRMSASHIGKVNSPHARKKISEANKGKPKPPGFSQRLRAANLGKKPSVETRLKMSTRMKSELTPERAKRMSDLAKRPEALAKMAAGMRAVHKRPEYAAKQRLRIQKLSRPVHKCDPLTGAVLDTFESCSAAARAHGVSDSQVSGCANKRKYFKSAGGFVWNFVEQPIL